MNRTLLTLLVGLLLASGCDNELDLTTPWEDIPIAYGLLSIQDTVHYVRVEKAFLDPETSALELAQVADSIYYGPEVTVSLRRESTGEVFQMDRINGEDVGIPRDPGAFANTPNILYALDPESINLQANDPVTLIIDRPTAGEATARTSMVGEISVGANASPNTVGTNGLTITQGDDLSLSYRTSDAATIYQTTMFIRVQEFVNGNSRGEVLVEWNLPLNGEDQRPDADDSGVFYTVPGAGFFTALAAALEEDGAVTRQITELIYVVTGASSEVDQLLSINSANTGITSSQERPTFSNLEGGEGLFGSIYRFELTDIGISSRTVQELRAAEATSGLNF